MLPVSLKKVQGEHLAWVIENIFGQIWSEFQVYDKSWNHVKSHLVLLKFFVSFLTAFLQTIGNSANFSTVRDLDWQKRTRRHGSFNDKCDTGHQICSSSLLYNLVLQLLRFSMWGTCCFPGLADKAARSELQTGKKHSTASVFSFWKHICFILL